jgi:Ca-activated chloride channel family protein
MSDSRSPSRIEKANFERPDAPPIKRGVAIIPSWMLSLLLHGGLIVVLAATLSARRGGIVGDPAGDFRRIGIYVGHSGDGTGHSDGHGRGAATNASAPSKPEPVRPEPESVSPPKTAALSPLSAVDARPDMPKTAPALTSKPLPVIGPGTGADTLVTRTEQRPAGAPLSTSGDTPNRGTAPSAGRWDGVVYSTRASGSAGPGGGSAGGGGPRGSFGTAPFFGIWDAGAKFIYVIDRSGSMFSYNAMQAAKNELLSSLQSLRRSQQFQVVFYNLDPQWMKAPGKTDFQYFPASESNRRLAGQFIAQVQPDGGTQHLPALQLALRLHPDVIFFLTDAGEPAMKPDELEEIRRLNGGRSRIHCVQFGLQDEPKAPVAPNFLRTLAAQNNGDYAYENVKRFAEASRPLPQTRASARPVGVPHPSLRED